ncbi:MAG: putative dehydrogenase [Bermanella sp.]|jgi:predicted dehydrogenase
MGNELKIGMLGAARIGYFGLIKPAGEISELSIAAVAARDPNRAQRYAAKHGIPLAHESYEALLADPSIDAIYNPLPNALHCQWSIRALEAGKHVLCEKPIASNASEAREMAAAAHRNGRVLMEAFHYRFHPLAARMCELVPLLGKIEHIDVGMCIPLPMTKDIRFNYALGGGATMDVGAYTCNILRLLAAASGKDALQQAPSVVSAKAKLLGENVDRAMRAELRWEDGTTGLIENSLLSSKLFRLSAKVRGSAGSMSILNPVAPQIYNHISLNIDGKKSRERVVGKASYTYQLEEFARRIRSGENNSDLTDAIANMSLIDSIYSAAGLALRGN